MTDSTEISANDTDAANNLAEYVDRIENLIVAKKDVQEDIKNVYAEAKSDGYDVKALRKVIANRQKDRAELEQLEGIVETYESALEKV